MAEYDPVIGMEVHIELQTNTKMFCGCKVAFGGEPNTRCCPVCLGLPGTLPVVNKKAIESMTKMALALNCKIADKCIFHRKNYYYPDMPKNYQISQYDNPLGSNGYLEIEVNGKVKKIAVRRVHMEEDAGKLTHVEGGKSHVDYNRTGVPLMEIVTMNPPPPGLDQIESADDAREYLRRLRQIAMYLGVSDCKMEEGSMRCEPNISIKPKGQKEFGVKTEIKNLNSFRVVALGVDYELKRHKKVLDAGGEIVQETRRWDDAHAKTVVMRVKEVEQEYRYFPEPDLVPMEFDKDWIEGLRASLPELPLAKQRRFAAEYGLSDTDAEILTDTREMADFYESIAKKAKDPKAVANWILGDFMKMMNATGTALADTKITPELLCGMLELIDKGTINRNIAKKVFEEMFETGKSAAQIVKEKGLEQVTDTGAIEGAVDAVIAAHPAEVERFKNGEVKLMGFFVGQIMRETKGKANPAAINKLLSEKLKS
ncbi:MAG: Asp-tRNA(Asn)/Glu-tRNA(Gln) amidotransferase subunit GatB [Abditibacteriota bacterium]|nr:Asp-tRNA(Asn)/Glu-tRNA(Gln) amidotransferase subunit GatB [Abditibacteriota bacterium]MBP5738427.1 Asp-tRNA(Asn)/Glu-tRNA(Gln) amidotransferase subunit GatB [Abditibacteriota bacterium]